MTYWTPTITYYQPTNEWCEKYDIASFEVWEKKESGMDEYPDIPAKDWVEYHDNDIEEPMYMDLA